MHAIERHVAFAKAVQRLEHEAVAAQRHDHRRFLGRGAAIAPDELGLRLLRLRRVAREKGEGGRLRRSVWHGFGLGAHPPVTLMCRPTEGRRLRRSITKSCPLGFLEIASWIAASSGPSFSAILSGVRKSAASSCPRHI